jgi:hypothetical protein
MPPRCERAQRAHPRTGTLAAFSAGLGRHAEVVGRKPIRTMRSGFLLFLFDLIFPEIVISSKIHIKWIKTQKNVK